MDEWRRTRHEKVCAQWGFILISPNFRRHKKNPRQSQKDCGRQPSISIFGLYHNHSSWPYHACLFFQLHIWLYLGGSFHSELAQILPLEQKLKPCYRRRYPLSCRWSIHWHGMISFADENWSSSYWSIPAPNRTPDNMYTKCSRLGSHSTWRLNDILCLRNILCIPYSQKRNYVLHKFDLE